MAPLWRLIAAMILACCVGSAGADDGAREAETSGTLPLSELPIVMLGGEQNGVTFAVYEDGLVVRSGPRSPWRTASDYPLKESLLEPDDLSKLLSSIGSDVFEKLPAHPVRAKDSRTMDDNWTTVWVRRGSEVRSISVYGCASYDDESKAPKIEDPAMVAPIMLARRTERIVRKYDAPNESPFESDSAVIRVLWVDHFPEDLEVVPWPPFAKYELLDDRPTDRTGGAIAYIHTLGPMPTEILKASNSRPKLPVLFEGQKVLMDHRGAFPGEFELKRMAKAGSSK